MQANWGRIPISSLVSSYTLGDPLVADNAAGVLRSIQRDAAGRITGYTHTNNGNPVAGLNQTFGYDNLDRLTTATQAAATTQYTYDETGNRTAKTIGGTTYSNTVSPTSNRLTQVQDPLGTGTIGYDAAGNTVGDGSFTYTYSDRGRMASVATGSGTVSYAYNGFGLRARKSGPSGLVASGAGYFVYDEAGQLLGEYDANGAALYETAYLGSTPVGVVKHTGAAGAGTLSAALYNVHADHIDTPRLVTAQDQAVVWRWDGAEAFGATAPDQNPSGLGSFAYNQRFPGQVFDAETGLFQNWNREYNARLGRYIQSDPIGLAGGINTFSYVENDPLSTVDPTGEIGVPGAAIGALFEIGVQAYKNHKNGCDVLDWNNYDWWDVFVSAGIGAVGPGWFAGAKGLYPAWVPFMGSSRGAGGALKALSAQAQRATTANRQSKIAERMARHRKDIRDDLITQGLLQGGKEAVRHLYDTNESCACRR